jgi:uncharacterized protein (DUF1800 family)
LGHFHYSANSTTDRQQISHTVSRLSFGIAPQQIATIEAQGIENYFQAQLNPSSIPESPKLTAKLAKFDTIHEDSISLYKTFQQYSKQLKEKEAVLSLEEKQQLQQKRNQHKRNVIQQSEQARLASAITSSRQLQEVMTNFWLDHFNVYAPKKTVAFWIADYERDIRENALGNFRDLLAVTAHHPAMLIYLDNDLNTDPNRPRKQGNAKGINENYARELMELHTLGVDGGYTQQDVTALARIFTGWGVDFSGKKGDENNFYFFPQRHDPTDKVFLGQTIVGSGIAEGERALDILANHRATAHFISYKLAQYFVADTPPETLVDTLTKTFLDSKGDIKIVLDTLFHSPEFNDSNYYRVKFKTPFQYLVSIIRASNLANPDLNKVKWMLSQLAMPIYGCESPNGYQNTESAWLNPDAMLRRLSYATNIAGGALSNKQPVDAGILQSSIDNISPKTQKTLAETPSNLKAAVILGSPEMMYR